jgi:adenylate cyclase
VLRPAHGSTASGELTTTQARSLSCASPCDSYAGRVLPLLGGEKKPKQPSIAVLPFDNLTGDPAQDYISDGLSENIIAVLATSPDLLVIARNSTFTYKGKAVDVREVAERLGVRYVLEGSVQMSGETVRVTTQLIDAINGHHVWAERYDNAAQDLANLLQLQDEIASQVLVELDVALTTGAHVRGVWAELKDLGSYRKFIRQRDEFLKFSSDGNREAERLAEEPIAERPQGGDPLQADGLGALAEGVAGHS